MYTSCDLKLLITFKIYYQTLKARSLWQEAKSNLIFVISPVYLTNIIFFVLGNFLVATGLSSFNRVLCKGLNLKNQFICRLLVNLRNKDVEYSTLSSSDFLFIRSSLLWFKMLHDVFSLNCCPCAWVPIETLI